MLAVTRWAILPYHMDGHAFVGDSLFVLGCGRVFEGTMAPNVGQSAKTQCAARWHANLLRP